MEQIINQDINPLKLFFQSTGGNDELHEKITDFFPAIISIYDVNKRKLKYINRKITEMLGYTDNDIKDRENDLTTIVYKDDQDLVIEEIEKCCALQGNETHSYKVRLMHKNGGCKYFRTQGTVLNRDRKGSARSLLLIAQDITEEVETRAKFKRIEELLTEQFQMHRELAAYKAMKQENEQFLSYGTWEYDAKSQRYFWSEGMYRLFGYDPEEKNKIGVTTALYQKHMREQDFENGKENFETIIKNRQENFSWEYQITSHDGQSKRIETIGKMLYDATGTWLKTIGTSRDITPLRQYQLNLEEKVKELDRSNKELEEFAYVASHDMNEPLRKINTFIERLEHKYKHELGQDGQLYLNRITASVDNMRLLIDTLLEFSRTARNNQPYTQVDLNSILTKVKADLELKIEETVADIQAGGLPVIEAVPAQMKQLFDNLISNSIKFRRPGVRPHIKLCGQKLSKKQKEQWNLDHEKIWYKIEFTDNGIGFEPEYSERIFQIFQRLHGRSEYPGSGIGLAICKKITDQHRGLIFASGEPAKGATFTVILPESQ